MQPVRSSIDGMFRSKCSNVQWSKRLNSSDPKIYSQTLAASIMQMNAKILGDEIAFADDDIDEDIVFAAHS